MNELETATVRQEHLCNLARFCQRLDAGLRWAGMTPEQCQATFRRAVSAECTGCGIYISGDELYALSQPPSAELASTKTGRLRLGDCARQGCEAWYYRVNLWPQSQLNWPSLLAQIDLAEEEGQKPAALPAFWGPACKRLMHSPLLPRIGIAFFVVVVLLVARHWQQGGRIPLLREPEKFQVDVAPEEESERATADSPGGP